MRSIRIGRNDACRWTLGSKGLVRCLTLSVTLLAICGSASARATIDTGQFGDPAFRTIWERSDLVVAEGRAARTWLWGPPTQPATKETYREASGDLRLVQYFDKGRMEVNNASADPKSPGYVTNGRLVADMMEGTVQVGFIDRVYIGPNETSIAGDSDSRILTSDTPTYVELYLASSIPPSDGDCALIHWKLCKANALPVGSTMPTLFMMGNGAVAYLEKGEMPPAGFVPVEQEPVPVKMAYYAQATQHNIPDVFWQFMNSVGDVYESGRYTQGQLVDWLATFGYPLTEPYWIKIKVGNESRLVLFQAFERRILTYSPRNQDGWKVEMGNVGIQYQNWRAAGTPSCQPRGVGHWAGVIDFWFNHPEIQLDLGCPNGEVPYNIVNPNVQNIDIKVTTAYQQFEHGAMLYVNRTILVAYKRVQLNTIYVMFDDGRLLQFEDTWKEGDPESTGQQPPTGLFEPVRGFGQVWRGGSQGTIRTILGWAVGMEQGGTGAMIRFQFGEIYWSSVPNKHFVFNDIPDSGPYPIDAFRTPEWEPRYRVYDDQYRETR